MRMTTNARRLSTATDVSEVIKKAKNIYCVGRNYVAHAHELGNEVPKEEPVLFLKANSSLRGVQDEGSTLFSDEVHHELEVVVQIKQHVPKHTCLQSPEQRWELISGIALGLDLTRRDKQKALKDKGLPWTLSKSFAGAGIIGPMCDLSEIDLPFPYSDLGFSLTVNDQTKQSATLGQMIFPIPFLIDFLLSYQHLDAGDLIFTGTPEGKQA